MILGTGSRKHHKVSSYRKYEGKKEWEFVNKDENGDIGYVTWSRVIEDKFFIDNFKSLVENKECLN